MCRITVEYICVCISSKHSHYRRRFCSFCRRHARFIISWSSSSSSSSSSSPLSVLSSNSFRLLIARSTNINRSTKLSSLLDFRRGNSRLRSLGVYAIDSYSMRLPFSDRCNDGDEQTATITSCCRWCHSHFRQVNRLEKCWRIRDSVGPQNNGDDILLFHFKCH